MCHRPSEPSADRALTVSVARRPTAWSCRGTIKSSSAVRNQPLGRPGDRRSPADSAPLPRDGRHRGVRATTKAIRARGAGAAVWPGPPTKIPSAVSSCALTSRPGGFRRYNSTIPRLLLVPLPSRLLARRSGSTAVHASHGGPPSAGVPVGSCSWWSRAAACDDRSGFLVVSDDGVTRGTSR